jgi:hypothetical protein
MKSPIILRAGPAALTRGLKAQQAIVEQAEQKTGTMLLTEN